MGLTVLMEVTVEEDGGFVLVVATWVGLEVDISGLVVVEVGLAVLLTATTGLIELL